MQRAECGKERGGEPHLATGMDSWPTDFPMSHRHRSGRPCAPAAVGLGGEGGKGAEGRTRRRRSAEEEAGARGGDSEFESGCCRVLGYI